MTTVPDLSGNTGGVDAEFAPERDGTPNYPFSVTFSTSIIGPKTGANSLSIVPASDATFVLGAGSALVGKFGIDQTTPGTTNAVVATGNVANAVADTGNPVKIGGVYSSATGIGVLTAGNRGDIQSDGFGNLRATITGNAAAPVATATTVILALSRASNQTTLTAPLGVLNYIWNGTNLIMQPGDASGTISQPYALAANRWSYAAAVGGIVSSTTGVTIAAAAGAGVRNYLSSIELEHDTLSAVTEFVIRDGAAGTVLWRGKLQTTATEGGARKFDPPLKGSANTLMEIAALTSVTGGIYFNGQGYIAA